MSDNRAEYEVEINGVKHRLLLDKEEVKRYPDAVTADGQPVFDVEPVDQPELVDPEPVTEPEVPVQTTTGRGRRQSAKG